MGKLRYAEETIRMMRESGEVKWCPVQGSKIVEFYKDKNVLVTGATGFLGKLLVEKLLRACPEINAIYILVRPKKGEDEQSRVEKLYSDVVFGPLSKIFPKFQHKINIIKGDMSLPNLGLTPASADLITEKINVIFHVAATVRFDEKLSVATAINVRGTRDLLNIAQTCKNLQSFVHVSTAYANCNYKEIDEVFYKPPITAEELIDLVEKTPEKTLMEKTPELIKGWPNTYAFTKLVAEQAVRQFGQSLPICVVRPAIVISTYKEPLRNWIDNLYGATGVLAGAGTGLLKTIYGDFEKTAELVPGDFVINNMIAASYQIATEVKRDKIPIYNYVSSVENRITWWDLTEHSRTWGLEVPTIRCVWYYHFTLNRYYPIHLLSTLLLQFLPGLIVDLGMILSRQSPIMTKVYKKVFKFSSVIAYFTKNEWKFHNDNVRALWAKMSEADKKMFHFSMTEFDWEDFHKTHMLGLRTYIIKDDLSTLPQARIKWRRFYIMDRILTVLFYFLPSYIIYSIFTKIMT